MARLILLFAALLLSGTGVAQQDTATPAAQVKSDTGLTILDQLPVRNQIPLLDNRFRIDDGVVGWCTQGRCPTFF